VARRWRECGVVDIGERRLGWESIRPRSHSVSSTKSGGLLLADAVESRYIVLFVNDLLSARGVDHPARSLRVIHRAVTDAKGSNV
jgi:hypothetical protein